MNNKSLLTIFLLACIIALPSGTALAANDGYLSLESVSRPEGRELYKTLISTADGGYAVAMATATDDKQGCLRKYNADGSLGFTYEYKLPFTINLISIAYCSVTQTPDDGYLLAADGAVLVKLDESGKEMWQKQLVGIADIYHISIAPNGSALLSVSEARQKTNMLLCVDENANVLWQKSREELGATGAGVEHMYVLPVIAADGNFAALTYDQVNNIVTKLDTNGNTLWKTDLPKYADADGLRYFNDMLGTSDGGLLLVGSIRGRSHLIKLSADGRRQWGADNQFSNYKNERLYSAIETDNGYIAVGRGQSITLRSKEDGDYYNDTIIACYDKDGKVVYGKAFYEQMESIKKIVSISGNRYIALASSEHLNYGTGLMHFNTVESLPQTGWEKVGNDWYYRYYGLRVRGWQRVGGKWYWFNPKCIMATGWLREDWLNTPWYFLQADGSMATGWVKVKGYWYFFAPDGAMQTGWLKDKGKWYYLDIPANYGVEGRMQTGWLKVGGSWYYFNASGAMLTGVQTIDGRKSNFASSGEWLGYLE